jgi:hypothetical protein
MTAVYAHQLIPLQLLLIAKLNEILIDFFHNLSSVVIILSTNERDFFDYSFIQGE